MRWFIENILLRFFCISVLDDLEEDEINLV